MTDTTTGTVIRAVPGAEAEWRCDAGLISGLLLDLLDEPLDAAPARTVRAAVRAWGRLSAALRTAHRCPELCLVTVHPGDVDALGAAARAVGRATLPGGDPAVVRALVRAASAVDTTPQRLVVVLARMHGVLDLDLGLDGERQVGDRVREMWRAGATEG